MDALLTLIVFSTLYFIGAVVIVKYLTGKTYEDATGICTGFLKRMGGAFYKKMTAPPPAPTTRFPVFIGIDDYGNPIPQLMRKYFSPFERFYEIVDFDGAGYSNFSSNILCYRLNCTMPKQNINDHEMADLSQRVAESCLRRYLQDYGYNDVPVQQVVAVRPVNGTMVIFIACNSDGIPEINHIRKQIRDSCFKNNPSQVPPLETNWEEYKE